MAVYLGDFAEDETVHFTWNTFDSSGASVTRATDGTVSVYKDNGVAQSTAGVTDTEDFDGLTGVHACTIDTSADAFYATGANYSVVLSGATIDGQSVNATLAHFSIENRYMRGTDSAALASVCTEARLAELAAANLPADVDTIKAAATEARLAELDAANLPADVDTIKGAATEARLAELDAANIPADIDALTASVAGLNDISAADVNAQCLDVVATDTMSEITGAADIPAEPTMRQALQLIYMWIRNNTQTTSNERRVFNDAGAEVLDATMSDDGTTFQQGKLGAP